MSSLKIGQCLVYFVVFVVINSCQPGHGHGKNEITPDADSYFIKFNPPSGTEFYYDISNEWETLTEVEGKEITNLNRTDAGITYKINRDTSNEYRLEVNFKKIHVYSKKGKTESEMDASNASGSLQPAERMLGALTAVPVTVIITAGGQVRSISGYQEIINKIMAEMSNMDGYSKGQALKQLMTLVEDGLVKKNMEQLFSIFPDSSIRIGSSWKKKSRQKAEIDLDVHTEYTFTGIEGGIAFIEAESKIISVPTERIIMSNNVRANLKGAQDGLLEVDAKTGIVINGRIEGKVKGDLLVQGKEIPIEIRSRVIIKGKRSN